MRRKMKLLAAAMGLMLTVPGLATAQGTRSAYGADGYGFVEAVKQRDTSKVLNYLQANGAAMLNFRNDKGEGALHVVTARRDSEWLAFFLSRGGDPNLGNGAGDTPLHLAARSGWDEGLKMLLDQRAGVDRTNRLGETPLIVAVQQRQGGLPRQEQVVVAWLAQPLGHVGVLGQGGVRQLPAFEGDALTECGAQ